MLKSATNFFSKNWGLLVLTIIFIPIVINTIQPDYYIAGWDNFSTSLNLSGNLEKTLFSTWREYRGLGVQSDSEFVDIFRQLLYLTASPFIKPQLFYQSYILLSFYLGIIGMYYLSKLLLSTHVDVKRHNTILEVSSIASALFYMFNLNTTATFFLPLLMYVTRFALLPWLTYYFIKIIKTNSLNRKLLIPFILISLFGSTAYITATVFITAVMLLVIIALTIPKRLRISAKLLFIFILLNSFWLLNFVNYTTHKSNLVSTAATFSGVNEIQLNENPDHFAWNKLLTFYPNIFYTQATKISDDTKFDLHPDANILTSPSLKKNTIYLFPILYLIGSLILIVKFKGKKYTRFVPITILFGLLMLRKTYPPLGFVFDWMSDNIPYFEILFRFGGTKFYALIAIPASIAGGIVILLILKTIDRLKAVLLTNIIAVLILITLIIVNITAFSLFYKGQLISPLVYNQIPKAYFEVASNINSDTDNFRVVHLPIGSTSYWKPYNWGYIGSNFLTFILDKPLFDKTFQPASKENEYVDQAILDLYTNAENINNERNLSERAVRLHSIFQTTNTKYIIYDNTLSIDLITRGERYWGEFTTEGAKTLLDQLQKERLLTLIKTYTVDTSLISNPDGHLPNTNTTKEIDLYQVNNPLPIVSSVNKATHTSSLHNALQLQQTTPVKPIVQLDNTGKLYPFYLNNIEINNNYLDLTSYKKDNNDQIFINQGEASEQVYDVAVKKDGSNLVIGITIKHFPSTNISNNLDYELSYPLDKFVNNQTKNNSDFLSDWHIIDTDKLSSYRLVLGNTVIPLPSEISNSYQFLTSVVANKNNHNLSILEPSTTEKLDFNTLTLTEEPNCYKDKSDGYDFILETDDETASLYTKNGTTCVTAPILMDDDSNYVETYINYTYNNTETEVETTFDTPSTYQKEVAKYISSLPTANYFRLCLIDFENGGCLNNHTAIKAKSSDSMNIHPVETFDRSTQLVLSLTTLQNQAANININNFDITKYKELISYNLPDKPSILKDSFETNDNIVIPHILSKYSFYFNSDNDAFIAFNEQCEKADQDRATKLFNDFTIQYSRRCQNGSYVRMPFDSSNFLQWSVDYNVLSGEYPKFFLEGGYIPYKLELLSFNQNYPNIKQFKRLQTSDPLYSLLSSDYLYQRQIGKTIENTEFVNAYTYIYPPLGIDDREDKLFTILNHSENNGIVALKNFNITHLPDSWKSLYLENSNTEVEYGSANIIEADRIIPSIWKITLQKPINNGDVLLSFGQGYDTQWRLYRSDSIIGAFIGIGKSDVQHVKINSLTNGWVIPENELYNSDNTTYIAIYSPERLTVLGIVVTITTIVVIITIAKKRKVKKAQKKKKTKKSV